MLLRIFHAVIYFIYFCHVKPLLYILIFHFSAGSLMPLNDFRQLTNLSFMLSHYQLHVEEAKSEGMDFDLLDFAYLHYISPDSHTHDFPVNHEDLPLKNIASSFQVFNPGLVVLSFFIPDDPVDNIYSFFDIKGRLTGSFVFHPPSVL